MFYDIEHKFSVQIYYEDTDHSGVVYHANFFKYFERAREHAIGIDKLLKMLKDGYGFAVYQASISYYEPVFFGETLKIISKIKKDTEYRLVWEQDAWKENSKKPAVKSIIQLVCIGSDKKLKTLPEIS